MITRHIARQTSTMAKVDWVLMVRGGGGGGLGDNMNYDAVAY
jgi:hypothetical protein